jgi:hypothetical protein
VAAGGGHRPEALTVAAGPPWRAALAAGALAVLALAVGRVAVHDPRDLPITGDQASFTYQALSLLGGDLSYDADDHARWVELGWEDQPRGLFVQRRDDGWAFAKPVGYSVLLAPAVGAAGARGIALVGAGLLAAYAGCWYLAGRLRWGRATSLAVAAAAAVASHAWFFGFPAHADLFLAVVVGAAGYGAARAAWPAGQPGWRGSPALWLSVSAVATAVLVTEKLPALVAVGPLLALAAWRAPWRDRLVAAGAGLVVLGVSLVPYLVYSDGASWSAYGGDRYYAPSTTPWSGGTEDDLVTWQTREVLDPGYVADHLLPPDADAAPAALTYLVGRHTGVLTFSPVVALLLGAAGWRAWRSRHEPPARAGSAGRVAAAAALGLAGYAAVYVLLFTDNYFGGGQSVGNRYFLQVSTLAAVVAVGAGVPARAARWCAAGAAAWALVVLGPHLLRPHEAFHRVERTSAAQRLLPFEHSQSHAWRFLCEPGTCVPPPLEPFGDG